MIRSIVHPRSHFNFSAFGYTTKRSGKRLPERENQEDEEDEYVRRD